MSSSGPVWQEKSNDRLKSNRFKNFFLAFEIVTLIFSIFFLIYTFSKAIVSIFLFIPP